MRRTVAIAVYEARLDGKRRTWWPLVPRASAPALHGQSEVRLRDELGKLVRDRLAATEPGAQEGWDAPPGLRLHRVHLDLSARGREGRRVSGPFPFVVEPRWFAADQQRLLAYHPHDPGAWFDAEDLAEVERLAPHFARKAWARLGADDLEARKSVGRDRLLTLSFTVEPRALAPASARPDAGARGRAGVGRVRRRVLSDLAVDQTARAIDGNLPLGVPREPYRAQLGRLLGGARPRPTVLVGRPGSGRSTLLARWVADRLEEDGYPLHRDADRIHHVWRLSGKRLIAGMQYVGDWEERVLDLAEEARLHRGILWFDDLHLFGRLGVTRQSERSFADFFRGPVQRGELVMVATATREQLARLEDDAPAFAGLFTRVAVEPTTTEQTRALLLAEVRRLEVAHPVAIHPFVPRTIGELAEALVSWQAAPGAPIELLRKVVAGKASWRDGEERARIEPADAIAQAAQEVGLERRLLMLDQPLDPREVEATLAARVIGQPEATAAATDVVLAVRAGLTDGSRPLAVHLFTGPTGTGKTELATALAEYLYGSTGRLLRFDMSELSGDDAVARLIGDRFEPEGLLTQRIREQPFAVVLLDEIEKAHPSVLALLLQLFDEGRLTDAAGEVASFRHAVIVMTSNLGAKVAAPIGFGDGAAAIMGEIARAVRDFFPPELWNRIDRVVRFRPLTPEVAARVVDKELAKLVARRGLRERNVFVYPGAAMRERAVAQAFDPRYGARTVKRWLEDHVASALAEALTQVPSARLTVARLRDEGATVAVDLEVLTEAEPIDGPFALTALREQAVAALVPAAEAMAREIDEVLVGEALRAQEEAARHSPRASELRYFVERYREELEALRAALVGERHEPLVRVGESDDEIVHDLSRRGQRPPRRGFRPKLPVTTVARFDHRSVRAHGRHRLEHGKALAALARARLLIEHLPALADPDAHAVTIELAPVGGPGNRATLGAITDAYRGLLPEGAEAPWFRAPDAIVRGDDGGEPRRDLVHGAMIVRDVLAWPALRDERGCHVVQTFAREAEMVRIDVRRGAGELAQVLAARADAIARFEQAVAAGEPADNPERLLPVVRVVTVREPARGHDAVVDIEDFVTGDASTVTVPSLRDAIAGAVNVRWSRTGGPR